MCVCVFFVGVGVKSPAIAWIWIDMKIWLYFTPSKINKEPKNQPIEKANHFSNLPFLDSVFVFGGVLDHNYV